MEQVKEVRELDKMKRQVKKELKKYPYKSRVGLNVNQTEKYAVVDKEGNVVDKFRLSTCAYQKALAWKKYYGMEVKVKKL